MEAADGQELADVAQEPSRAAGRHQRREHITESQLAPEPHPVVDRLLDGTMPIGRQVRRDQRARARPDDHADLILELGQQHRQRPGCVRATRPAATQHQTDVAPCTILLAHRVTSPIRSIDHRFVFFGALPRTRFRRRRGDRDRRRLVSRRPRRFGAGTGVRERRCRRTAALPAAWTGTLRPGCGRARGSVGSAPTPAIAPSARSPADSAGNSDTCQPFAGKRAAHATGALGFRAACGRGSLAPKQRFHVRGLASKDIQDQSVM